MKLSIFLSTIFLHVLLCKSDVLIPPEHRFFTQRLDHFDRNNNETWQQRFFLKTVYALNGSAPNILGLNDGIAHAHHAEEGLFVEQAKRLQANLFITDVRYFGYNRPTKDLSDENIKYHTIEQMAEDIIYFVQGMHVFMSLRDPYHEQSNYWIIEGCGTSGMIAIFARIKRPDLFIGAVACGAPLIATLEHWQYFVNAFNYIREEDPECLDNIREGFRELDAISKTTSAAQELGDSFVLCSVTEDQSILKEKDISTLYYMIAHLIVAPITEHEELIVRTFPDVCAMMKNNSAGRSAYKRLAKVIDVIRMDKNQACIPLYDDYIKKLKDISYSAQLHEIIVEVRQRKFVQCSQSGVLTTSKGSEDVLFGDKFNLEFLLGICKDTFPSWNRENLEKYVNASKIWIDEKLLNLTNVAFVNENSAPFRSRFYHTKNSKSVNIDIPGSGGCNIFGKSTPKDPVEVIRAREQITSLLIKWSASARQ